MPSDTGCHIVHVLLIWAAHAGPFDESNVGSNQPNICEVKHDLLDLLL